MINYSKPFTWEPPLSPPSDTYEEEKKIFILGRIEDFAESITLNGMESPKIRSDDNELIDTLYEYIEDNLEKFLLETCYDV